VFLFDQVSAQSYSVDIPMCPHANLPSSSSSLTDQNTSDWTTVGLGPVGFSISGVAITGPLSENKNHFAQDSAVSVDT
jgi:hypothetical protein